MVKCLYCGADSPDDFNFCVNCERQTKCTNAECGTVLLPNKTRCLKCGRPLVADNPATVPMNSYIRDVKQTTKTYHERTEIRATNEAVSDLAPLLAGGTRSPIPRPAFPNTVNRPLVPMIQEASVDGSRLLEHDNNYTEPPIAPIDVNSAVRNYFVLDGDDGLVARVRDFKGSTKKEQQKRLIVLTAWAYYALHNGPVPSKDYFKSVAIKSKLHDDNFRIYLAEAIKEYFSSVGSGFILSTDGEKKAFLIIDELNDESVEGFAHWEPSAKTGRKLVKTNRQDQDKIAGWTSHDLDLGKLDIRSLGSPRNYAMFSLWAITVKLQLAAAVKPREAYLYLKGKYETMPVKPDEFTDVLSRKMKTVVFAKNNDGLYYLTEPGQKMVEEWIAGTSTPGTAGASEAK